MGFQNNFDTLIKGGYVNLREKQEQHELNNLSAYASFSIYSKGRVTEEDKCDVRTDFQRDRDRIIHSKAFRRLKDKTQVFISPIGDHIRTRLTHTLEVSQISRTISRALYLNEDLTEAIALAHDLGHTPFGHIGENTLNEISPYGFSHNIQSARIVERLEKNGRGLNLTLEVIDGIINHRTSGTPNTLEGKVVQIADKIAYLNHDIDDAVVSNVLTLDDIPRSCIETFGIKSSSRINAMIWGVINGSSETNITVEDIIKTEMKKLRDFMFDRIYLVEERKKEMKKVSHVVSELYDYYINENDTLFSEYKRNISFKDEKPEIIVCDYISGMTDRFALNTYSKIFLPGYWNAY